MCNKIKRERRKINRKIRRRDRKDMREWKKGGTELTDEEILEIAKLERELEEGFDKYSTSTSTGWLE